MKYRSRADIIHAILSAANGGTKPTRIMYAALISYRQACEYLDFCSSRGLLVFENGCYCLTERGRNALDLLEELEKILAADKILVEVPAR